MRTIFPICLFLPDRDGRISSAEFAALFPHGADYLPGLSWQPTNALFWEQFNNPTNYKDFTLGPEELAVFQTNGFVVSERLGGESFAGVFYDLWHSDLPVFITIWCPGAWTQNDIPSATLLGSRRLLLRCSASFRLRTGGSV